MFVLELDTTELTTSKDDAVGGIYTQNSDENSVRCMVMDGSYV